jgi:hypothetical protein
MRRREFIATLVGGAVSSVGAYAQQTGKVYSIGFLTAGASGVNNTPGIPAFVKCPSSNALGQCELYWNGGSGSFGVGV